MSPAARVIALVFLTEISGPAQSPAVLPEMMVLAERGSGGAVIGEWNREEMRKAAPRTIDELLTKEPSFSLYRRQTAIFGNPSSAGVSLRNTGATAASRTLVLLDGVPQNDPFGGWMYWARYDAAALDSIRIVPFARAAVWGNQSPAGVVQMHGAAPFDERHVIRLGGGSHGTISSTMVHQMTNAEKTKAISFSAFGTHSDGFFAVGPSQRGPIDRKLDIDLWGTDVKGAWLAAPGLTVEPKLSYYSEQRGNGTPLAGNSTDALDFSLRITGENAGSSWQAIAWHQRREFESVFSSVNADRTAETMALDQFDVPGRGIGGAITMQWDHGDQFNFMVGTDMRLVSGETNEDAGTFRRRVAGGDQDFVGLFGMAEYQPDERTTVNASARVDAWRLSDGRRLETSLITEAVLRSENQNDRGGIDPSASVELTRQLSHDLEARVSAGTAFRVPTLNELHRPYRVRNDIVEANPELDPERFITAEAGLTWTPTTHLTINAALFHHWISDAIANVPVTDPAEISAIFGTIPPGGSGSIKRNVEAARVAGIEVEAEWRPREDVTFDVTGMWSETRFSESKQQPLLEDKPFPQAPDLRLIASGEWRPREELSLFAGIEYGAVQYDDALAERRIPEFTSARIGMAWRTEQAVYQIRVENLFDEDIQTGLSSDGIRTFATPRSLWLSVEWAF